MSTEISKNANIIGEDMKEMRKELQSITTNKKVFLKDAYTLMLDVLDPSSPLTFSDLLANRKQEGSVIKLTAKETTMQKLIEIFSLRPVQPPTFWQLLDEQKIEAPTRLSKLRCCFNATYFILTSGSVEVNLKDLDDAFYEPDNEATCRIAIDFMLVQCRKHFHRAHPPHPTYEYTAGPSTPAKAISTSPKPLRFYPECTISVDMPNPSDENSKFIISGRADWALGYDSKEGALLVAVEAKKRSELMQGQAQLLAYLCILREHRRRAGKTNTVIQGFYSDGNLYWFMCLKDDGTVMQSLPTHVRSPEGANMAFSFIIAMMEAASKSTPNASPTKSLLQQKKEVSEFRDEGRLKTFEELVIEESDEDMEDVEDFSNILGKKS